jgi:hypothetical protein
VVLAVAVSSGAVSVEYKFIRTNERPKPPPQRLTVELPAQTVETDDVWKDAPALDAEFSRDPIEHKPRTTQAANFADYRQKARSVRDG